jgi:hypothetical protein
MAELVDAVRVVVDAPGADQVAADAAAGDLEFLAVIPAAVAVDQEVEGEDLGGRDRVAPVGLERTLLRLGERAQPRQEQGREDSAEETGGSDAPA